MPTISELGIFTIPETKALVVNKRLAVADLPAAIGESFQLIGGALAQNDAPDAMSGCPFVEYRNMDMNDLDVAIGFPVVGDFTLPDGVEAEVIPEGTAVVYMHLGPYDAMEPGYEAAMNFAAQRGYRPTGTSFEMYWNGPETPGIDGNMDLMLTEVRIYVEKAA